MGYTRQNHNNVERWLREWSMLGTEECWGIRNILCHAQWFLYTCYMKDHEHIWKCIYLVYVYIYICMIIWYYMCVLYVCIICMYNINIYIHTYLYPMFGQTQLKQGWFKTDQHAYQIIILHAWMKKCCDLWAQVISTILFWS